MTKTSFRITLFTLIISLVISPMFASEYKKALQYSIYYFETAESGELSPGNRVPWRGPSHTLDGFEWNLQLDGGWYDAGDHWKASSSIAYSLISLNWGAYMYPDSYTTTGQWKEFLNGIEYATRYLSDKVIQDGNPSSSTNFSDYNLYFHTAGKHGAPYAIEPSPNIHFLWAPPETTEMYCARETLRGNSSYPAPDQAGLIAAALASSAIILDEYGDAGQRQYAAGLLNKARKVERFGLTYTTVVDWIDNKFAYGKAERSSFWNSDPTWDGPARYLGRRCKTSEPSLALGASWLYEMEQHFSTGQNLTEWKNAAIDNEAVTNALGGQYLWWRTTGLNQVEMHAALALLQFVDDAPSSVKTRIEADLKTNMDVWTNCEAYTHYSNPPRYSENGTGLLYRPNGTGPTEHTAVKNQGRFMLYMMYYRTCTDSALKAQILNAVKSQADYILGDNASGRSYVIGIGSYKNSAHFRGALGGWASWEHSLTLNSAFMPENRHMQYGTLVSGPIIGGAVDTWEGNWWDYTTTEPSIYWQSEWQSVLAALVELDGGSGTVDSTFPEFGEKAQVVRNDSLDINDTDREFFVHVKRLSAGSNYLLLKTELHNRSRWPARSMEELSYRYYFSMEGGATINDYAYTFVEQESGANATAELVDLGNGNAYLEVTFDNWFNPQYKANSGYDEATYCRYSRYVKIKLSASSSAYFDFSNDFSYNNIQTGGVWVVNPKFPVYSQGSYLEGETPFTTFQVEAEDDAVAVNDNDGDINFNSDYASIDSNKHVTLKDVGDAIGIPFSLSEGGTFKLKVRLKCGGSSYPDGYWDQYAFSINGTPVTFTADMNSRSILESSTYFGTMEATVTLSGGSHELVIEALKTYCKVDYIRVEQ